LVVTVEVVLTGGALTIRGQQGCGAAVVVIVLAAAI
jgi:hypothetical protein